MNVLRLVRKSIHTALLGKTSKIDRRTRLLRNYVVCGCLGQLQRTGHYWGGTSLLQWMSGTVIYREPVPLVTAGVGDHCYSS